MDNDFDLPAGDVDLPEEEEEEGFKDIDEEEEGKEGIEEEEEGF